MAEIKIRFDLTFSRRFVIAAGAAVIVLCAVPELDSESVTLSTYYPAPSGVYTNMITTDNTYLARDNGNVGVGTASPAAKLHVRSPNAAAGDASLFPTGGGSDMAYNGGTDNLFTFKHEGALSGSSVFSSNNNANSLVIRNTGRVGIRNANPTQALTVSGNVEASGYQRTLVAAAGCVQLNFAAVGITSCPNPVTQYATFAPGIFVPTWVQFAPPGSVTGGYMFCCPR